MTPARTARIDCTARTARIDHDARTAHDARSDVSPARQSALRFPRVGERLHRPRGRAVAHRLHGGKAAHRP
ncbi:hypothetical protein [Streptomyces sp. CC210A]|uniref:hypothetical protein n=1 Tax=Streptomyces sp. CC210A TaxID=2898184 RepID=UPI001F270936|nr:hypothetical protein [Streptomyces sp. CC210A]